MLRFVSMFLLLAMLLCCGCTRAAEDPAYTNAPVQEEVLLPLDTEADAAVTAAGQPRTVDGTLTLENEQLRIDRGPALHVLSGGSLTAIGLTLDRIAGAEQSTAEQAAILVESGGHAALAGSALASDASGAPLLYSRGNAELSDTVAVLSGANTAMFLASDGGSIRTARCNLLANGSGSTCLYAKNNGRIDCGDGTHITSDDPDGSAIHLADGSNVNIHSGTVSGDVRFSGAGNTLFCAGTNLTGNLCFDTIEDEIELQLLEGSVFTGTTDGEGAMSVSVTLDAESRWVLTSDAYVAALNNVDQSFSNIESNGNTLYYNAEAEANLWLGGRSIELSGGGYLIPLI